MDVARNGDDDSNNNYDNNNKNILRYLVSFAISDFIYIILFSPHSSPVILIPLLTSFCKLEDCG